MKSKIPSADDADPQTSLKEVNTKNEISPDYRCLHGPLICVHLRHLRINPSRPTIFAARSLRSEALRNLSPSQRSAEKAYGIGWTPTGGSAIEQK
jgi:hypothetical protein